jgi:hypothetical protein
LQTLSLLFVVVDEVFGIDVVVDEVFGIDVGC